jgi:P-type E1-E2 ATPase
MLSVCIPGFADLALEYLVCDYNGTLACDGQLLNGIAERLAAVAGSLAVHVVTGDTFGRAAAQVSGLHLHLTILPASGQDEAKAAYVHALGAAQTVAIGNGLNDRAMLATAALGIAVLGPEGAAGATLAAAHVVAADIFIALDLLAHPRRLVATLRR